MSSNANMRDMQIEDVNPSIGARVAALRKARFSQAELAQQLSEKLGKAIDPTTITRLEGGKRPITATEIVALAEIFGISPAELLPEWQPIEASERYWSQRASDIYLSYLETETRYQEEKTQLSAATDIAHGLRMLREYKRVREWCDAYSTALLEVADAWGIANAGGQPNSFIEILEDLGLTSEQIVTVRGESGIYDSIQDEHKLAVGAIRVLSGQS